MINNIFDKSLIVTVTTSIYFTKVNYMQYIVVVVVVVVVVVAVVVVRDSLSSNNCHGHVYPQNIISTKLFFYMLTLHSNYKECFSISIFLYITLT